MARIDDVYMLVKKYTLEMIENNSLDNAGIDALKVSLKLQLNRANVSRDLNTLWKNGKLVKIHLRPVLFLDSLEIKKHYSIDYLPQTIVKDEKISHYLSILDQNTQDDIDEIVGASDSLQLEIQKIKAAISYPPYGLNILLIGQNGVGKSNLAKKAYQYALDHKIKANNSAFLTINCQSFADNNNIFSVQLFGAAKGFSPFEKEIKGAIALSQGGVVYLENAEKLSSVSFNQLLNLLENKSYSPVGSNKTYPLDTTIILSTTTKTDLTNLLESYVSTIIRLEPIDKRSAKDKIEYILEFFSQEAKNIHKAIRLPKDILYRYACIKYKNNMIEMKSEIKEACSKAYLRSIENNYKFVNILLQDLSIKLLEYTSKNPSENSQIHYILSKFTDNNILFDSKGNSDTIDFFKKYYSQSKNELVDLVKNFNVDTSNLDTVNDFIFQNLYGLSNSGKYQINIISKSIDTKILYLFDKVVKQYDIYELFFKNTKLLLGLFLHLNNLKKQKKSETKDVKPLTKKLYPQEYEISTKIINEMERVFKISINTKEIDYVASYLAITTQWINRANVSIIVITHGNAYAEELVKTVKKLSNTNIKLDYINYNFDMQLNDVMELALLKAKQINAGGGVIICYDMEPLGSLAKYINTASGIKTTQIANVSVSTLLNLIEKATNKYTIEEISTSLKPREEKDNKKNFIFLNKLVNSFIKPSLTFLDAEKAVDNLFISLTNILEETNMIYTNDIAVKFFTHSVHMLERVIKNIPLNYPHLNKFISNNQSIYHSVEKNFSKINEIYGINIPSDELAYITEIFINYEK